MSATPQAVLMTAEEFALLPEVGPPRDLIRGRIVEYDMPGSKHGYLCVVISAILFDFAKKHQLGRVMSNDTFVKTQRGPDPVRGADVCFVSFSRLPPGDIPDGLLDVVPELVVEVRSPSDRWIGLVAKAAESIEAGVMAVAIADPKDKTLTIYRPDVKAVTLNVDDQFEVPDILPGLSVSVRQFFE